MILKSIEIRGFKSFADKTELNFKKGVTAVVGPNGSGKSNISDAIRWVLGEQSAKSLRGGKMEDVIFAGTQFRKAVGLAQVSLTLDNSSKELPIDYSDITISRRLYRSGESEYFLNNTPCRLRDIHELFMDTGIGKEGYSIIGQGKIDAILSGRPEERRALLEEAAGIVKFKSRKEEAEKKLETTENNLTRIRDILTTYEERLEPLRIENEKAKEFIKLSEELKDLEISLIVFNLGKLERDLENNNKILENVTKDIDSLNTQKQDKRKVLEEYNEKLDNHEKQQEEDRVKYYEEKEKIQNIKSEIQIFHEKLNYLRLDIDEQRELLKDLNEKLLYLQELKETNEKNTNSRQLEQRTINDSIDELENKLRDSNTEINSLEKELNHRREDEIEILKEISDFKNKKSIIENEMKINNTRLEQVVDSCNNFENSIKINLSTQSLIKDEISKISLSNIDKENEIKKFKNEMSHFLNEISKEEKEVKTSTANLNKLEANYNMLINLEKQYEGYNKAVKILMNHIQEGRFSKAQHKTHVLGDIIKVKKSLEVAIEIALGGAISDIITEDEVIAKDCIQYLKANNIGRATFLPLNIIRSKNISFKEQIKQIPGYIGIGSEVVSYEDKYREVINYVLGRTIICETMDSGLNIAKAMNYSCKIVTLEGEVINPGGALTGGSSFIKNTSIIGRKREIDETKTNIEILHKEINSIQEKISLGKEKFKRLDETCLNLKDEIHFNNIEITKLQTKLNNMEQENNKILKNIEVSRKEIDLINEKIQSSKKKLKEQDLALTAQIEKEESNKNRIEEIEQVLKNQQELILEEKNKLTELKIKKAQIDEIVSGNIRELVRISKEIEDNIGAMDSITLRVNTNEKEILRYNNLIKVKEEEILKLDEITKGFQEAFEKNEVFKISLRDSIKKVSGELDELSLIIQKKEDEIHKLALLKTKLDMEKENSYTKLNEEYSITYAEALDFSRPVDNTDKFKQEIYILKSSISKLGMVNLGAIEEYEEVTTKYSFMNSQKEDLEKAKYELVNVISEMTEKMKIVFNENFKILKVYFNETFKELFKGGSADLILTEGDELSANIDINVQPPGKKLQNINLMSGGEKVLSAIALLFSILKMKPTPFCILDEIEAALDDANVFRYAEFLKKFSTNIQFIVITHRKGTMEASDVLYGVTMEEKGISKIVSVDLSA